MPLGSLIQRARLDAQRYLEGSFSVELTLDPNNGDDAIIVQGLATRHSTTYNPDTGLEQVGENCHCSFSEQTLNDAGVTTRDARGKLILRNWLVSWDDITGIANYKIREVYPDESLGLIKCLLALYE